MYKHVRLHCPLELPASMEIIVESHCGIRGRRPAPGYDRLPERRWAARAVVGDCDAFLLRTAGLECAEHGVLVPSTCS